MGGSVIYVEKNMQKIIGIIVLFTTAFLAGALYAQAFHDRSFFEGANTQRLQPPFHD